MNKRARRGIWLVALVIVLAVALAAGWYWTQQIETPLGEAGQAGALPEPVIRESKVQPGEQVLVVAGQWRALREATVRTHSAGQIATWNVQDGAIVEEGDLLGQMALGDLQARRGQAQARVNIARHQARTLRQLVAGGYEPQERLTAAEAELESAQAELASAEQAMELMRIRAPMGGRVSILVESGVDVPEGTDVAHVVDRDPLQAVLRVEGKHAARLNAGALARLDLPGVGTVEGRVMSVSKTTGQKDGVRAEIEIPNPDHLQPAGSSVEIRTPL
ncbi:RND family efflux transporter, MFP subunit [Halopseudomonas xinjiangensis]|uniref:RND family efflux transporter, MFP subunit n=1 Tax=Halopseudomonas xinjiangensis TaxID=487184 RepID=A0A1H1LUX3_9GAMM|nr:efflux RND transporter periplasmic adaptor subunit [Halopseudomonas xinjiangensis]SDR78303.1 RND family efflux transporter, MFP subunit [Halopseudomonas xinjiangensis]